MGYDSDKLNATYKPLLDKARADASKRSGTFDPPPEPDAVRAQRDQNDRRGRAIAALKPTS